MFGGRAPPEPADGGHSTPPDPWLDLWDGASEGGRKVGKRERGNGRERKGRNAQFCKQIASAENQIIRHWHKMTFWWLIIKYYKWRNWTSFVRRSESSSNEEKSFSCFLLSAAISSCQPQDTNDLLNSKAANSILKLCVNNLNIQHDKLQLMSEIWIIIPPPVGEAGFTGARLRTSVRVCVCVCGCVCVCVCVCV